MLVADKSGLSFYAVIFSVFHECGHLFAMKKLGCPIKSINFGCVNTDIFVSEFNKLSDLKLIVILLSGSFVNIFIYFIFRFLFFGNALAKIIAYQNLFIGIINLLPILNLDGGQIFLIILNQKYDFSKAQKIYNIISLILIFPVFILSFFILLNSNYNFSLLLISCYFISYILFKEDIF